MSSYLMAFMRNVIKCTQSTYNFNPLWNDVSQECKDIETQEAEHRDPVFICNIKQWRFTGKKRPALSVRYRDPVFICNIEQWTFTGKKDQHYQLDTFTVKILGGSS